MSFKEIQEVRDRVVAKLENSETEEVVKLTLEELSTISGGVMGTLCYQWGGYYYNSSRCSEIFHH
jgi:hypothetical protein